MSEQAADSRASFHGRLVFFYLFNERNAAVRDVCDTCARISALVISTAARRRHRKNEAEAFER